MKSDDVPGWRPPLWRPLLPWSRLGPWLRRSLGDTRPGREPDLVKITAWIAVGRFLRRIPQRPRQGWSPRICLLLDHAPHLWTYGQDINHIWRRLKKLRGDAQVEVRLLVEAPSARPKVRIVGATDDTVRPWRHPGPGVPLLVLGDLGMLASSPEIRAGWLRFGQSLARANVPALALCPAPAARVPADLIRHYTIHEWDRSARLAHPVRPGAESSASATAAKTTVEELLTRLAPALRVEAPLLRALRTGLAGHAVVEADIQRHPDLVRDGGAVCLAGEEARDRRRQAFVALPRQEQRRVAELLDAYHGGSPSLAMTERGLIAHLTRDLLESEALAVLNRQERDQLDDFQGGLARLAKESGDSFLLRCWLRDNLARQGEAVVGARTQLQALWALANRDALRHNGRLELPDWGRAVDLRYFLDEAGLEPRACRLVQVGDQLRLETESQPLPVGAVIAECRLHGNQVTIDLTGNRASSCEVVHFGSLPLVHLDADLETIALDMGAEGLQLAAIPRPSWATAIRRDDQDLFAELPGNGGPPVLVPWVLPTDGLPGGWLIGGWRNPPNLGQDEFGLYAEFSVQGVTQRCRWIQPGSFRMGSPQEEEGRYEDEGPQHEVTLCGYWLADTACTQALWQVVLGENPSYFKDDPQNPVETVSWDEVQRFCARLNELVPGLAAALPTEAQWEYACRAGTTTPFSCGQTISREQANFDNALRKTVAVRSFAPNPWGLYEMHGNVWEWCADWFGPYAAESQLDPAGPANGRGRVLRGGSWLGGARFIRSAYRGHGDPGLRDLSFGFRVAPGRPGQAEPAAGREAVSEAGQGRGTRTVPASDTAGNTASIRRRVKK